MKTQAKVAIGIAVLLVAGLLGYFLSVNDDASDQAKAIDNSATPAAVSDADRKAAEAAGVEGVLLSWGGTDVVVQEFLDFQCPGCRAQTALMADLLDKYQGKITVVARPLPLTNIHRNATSSWLAALAANDQGKFGEMYKELFNTQDDWSGSQDDESELFRGYAEELGLDMTAYDAYVASPQAQQYLNESVAAATSLGATGTPAWILNDQLLELQNDNTLNEAVAEKLAAAGGAAGA